MPSDIPAFPRPVGYYPNVGCSYNSAQSGMTLRDYFAAAALTGILAAGDTPQHVAAYEAFAIADWMLEQKEVKR